MHAAEAAENLSKYFVNSTRRKMPGCIKAVEQSGPFEEFGENIKLRLAVKMTDVSHDFWGLNSLQHSNLVQNVCRGISPRPPPVVPIFVDNFHCNVRTIEVETTTMHSPKSSRTDTFAELERQVRLHSLNLRDSNFLLHWGNEKAEPALDAAFVATVRSKLPVA